MPNQSRFPRTDADFSNFINIVFPYLNANKARLVTTPTATNNLSLATSLLTNPTSGWNYTYQLCLNPVTATTTVTANKNTLRTQFETWLRSIYDDIPKSVLTQTDRDTLNIPLRTDSRTPATVPTAIPSISISSRAHLSATFTIVDSAHPQLKGKPDGVELIEIESAFLPAGTTPPAGFPQDSDFRFVATSGKTNYTHNYTSDQLKGTEYVKVRYFNSRNDACGWSEIITVVVS